MDYGIQLICIPISCLFQRDKELEAQALDWVEANLGEPVDRKSPYEDVLRDGIILCKLVSLSTPLSLCLSVSLSLSL
jgi:hypothetical protein